MRYFRTRLVSAVGAATLALVAAVSVFALQGGVASADLADGNVSIKVLSPQPGAVITGPDLALHVAASRFRIDSRYAGTPVSAEIGHYHEIIDGHLIDMAPMRDGNRDTIPMVGVTPGPHVLTIVPARNDHSEVTAAAVNVPFTYAGAYLPEPAGYSGTGTPSIVIPSPTTGATVQGGSVTLTADVSNFVLCGDCYGKTNVAGEGHWHIFLDLPQTAMDPMTMMPHMLTMAGGTTQDVSLKGISAGPHMLTAVLVGNDHMPVMPMAMSSVMINVRSGERSDR